MPGKRNDPYRGKHASQLEEKQSFTASMNAAVDKVASTPQKRKALWVAALVLFAVALLLAARFTYSAFTAGDFLKAVPVTGESQSLFASDTLAPYKAEPAEKDMASRDVVVDTSGKECSFTFKIYNCLLDDPNVFNDKEVVYNLSGSAKSTIDGATVASGWSISPEPGKVELPGTKGVIKTYTVTMNTDLVDKTKFCIKATVDTDNSPGTTLACLAAKVTPAQRADVESAAVTGAWADTGNASDYDAYNYRVTVTGKTQDVTLNWDNGVVELDPFFETNHPGCTFARDASGKPNAVTYSAEPGSEIVNFYRAGSSKPSAWSDINVSVSGSN